MADTSPKVVRFGLTNVHYALLNENEGTYGTPVRIPGGVKMTTTAEGDSSTFNADNGPFYVTSANSGYTGQLEIASADDQLLVDLLGYEVDKNGMVVEFSDAIAKPFALMFEVSSNVKPQRFVFYSVTLSRPSTEANTMSDSVEPDTLTLDFTAIAQEFSYGTEKRPSVKGHITKTTETATAYGKFFDAVMPPEALSA